MDINLTKPSKKRIRQTEDPVQSSNDDVQVLASSDPEPAAKTAKFGGFDMDDFDRTILSLPEVEKRNAVSSTISIFEVQRNCGGMAPILICVRGFAKLTNQLGSQSGFFKKGKCCLYIAGSPKLIDHSFVKYFNKIKHTKDQALFPSWFAIRTQVEPVDFHSKDPTEIMNALVDWLITQRSDDHQLVNYQVFRYQLDPTNVNDYHSFVNDLNLNRREFIQSMESQSPHKLSQSSNQSTPNKSVKSNVVVA